MKKRYIFYGMAVLLLVILYIFISGRVNTDKKNTAMVSQATSQSTAGTQDMTATIEVAAEKQRMLGIRTVAVEVKPLKKTLRTAGRVEYDERRLTTVNIKVEGWIEKLYADYTGKYVSKGAPLADIYSPELLSLQLEYLNLLTLKSGVGFRYQRNIEFSWGDRYGTVGRSTTTDLEGLFAVAKQKFDLWGITEEQVKQIENTKQPIKTITIKSPASGYVFQKPAARGARVTPGDKIFDIVDLSTVWVLADIYEYELPFIKIGQPARITLNHYPEKEFLSKVDFIYPTLSGQTRTLKVRFVLPNPGLLLKPQMLTNVEIEIDLGDKLAVPDTSILDTGTRQVVYVDHGDGYFSPRQVKIGARAGGVAEVLSGLNAGEKVAASAVFLLDSEAKLKGISP